MVEHNNSEQQHPMMHTTTAHTIPFELAPLSTPFAPCKCPQDFMIHDVTTDVTDVWMFLGRATDRLMCHSHGDIDMAAAD